jgi:uncharacterized protein YnzC (UPF0291/DUF896 family)
MEEILDLMAQLNVAVVKHKTKAVTKLNYQEAALFREYEKKVREMTKHMLEFKQFIDN